MVKQCFILFIAIILLMLGCSKQTLSNQTSQNFSELEHANLAMKQAIPANYIPKNLHIVALGDSLTEGVGDTVNNGGYLVYLKKMLKEEKAVNQVKVSNYGKKGITTSGLLKILQNDKLTEEIKEADLIIITIGGNDLMKVIRENIFNLSYPLFEEPQQNFEQRLDDIISNIRKKNPTSFIILVGLYNPFDQWFDSVDEMKYILNDWNDGSEEVLKKYSNTIFIKVDDIFENHADNLLSKDKFHPNNLGYELIAKRIYHNLNVDEIFYEQKDHVARN